MSSESNKVSPSTFVWYELHTPDAVAAGEFYRAVFGWGVNDAGMSDRQYSIVTVGEIPIGGLLPKSADHFTGDARSGWIGYIGVKSVDESVARLQQAGGFLHKKAEDIPNVGRFAVVADPDGAIFVLFQPPDSIQQPARPAPGATGSVAWHDLAAIEWQSDFDFYSGMFGWKKENAVDMGPNGVYQVFSAGAEPIGGMMTRMDPTQHPGWLFYFNVEDIHAAIARATKSGGTIVHGPSEVPGGQQIAHCVDPQGAIFGMVTPRT